MDDPTRLSIAEATCAFERKELSPLELASACLQRVEATQESLQAFSLLEPERVVEDAARCSEELARGEARGALHGIPIAIKDLIDVSGQPTTAGSSFLSAIPAHKDATVVARLRSEGAVITGKTRTHEFAYGVTTPACRNPWDRERVAGGSSGGSSVAVAVGSSLGALGTDTAGSIRIPGSFTGVVGLKPRRGIVPLDGVIRLAPTLDTCGPIAATPEDVSMLWSVIAGARERVGEDLPSRVGTNAGWREIESLDTEVVAAVDAAVEALVAEGMTPKEVDAPDFKGWDRPRATLLMAEALAVHRSAGWYPVHAADYSDETRAYLEYAEGLSPEQTSDAVRCLRELSARLEACFREEDVLVLPTTPMPAPTVRDAEEAIGPTGSRLIGRITRLCGPINCCRLAAITVPCGLTDAGLPIGLQIVGQTEEVVLAVATRMAKIVQLPPPPIAA